MCGKDADVDGDLSEDACTSREEGQRRRASLLSDDDGMAGLTDTSSDRWGCDAAQVQRNKHGGDAASCVRCAGERAERAGQAPTGLTDANQDAPKHEDEERRPERCLLYTSPSPRDS